MKNCLPAFVLLASVAYGQTADPVHAMETAARRLDANEGSARSKTLDAQGERAEFNRLFNQLIDAMREFTDEYNKGGSAVWPGKKADAVEKAYQELQKTRSWKQAQKSKEPPTSRPPASCSTALTQSPEN